MFQRQFVSELRRCEEMERQLSEHFLCCICLRTLLRTCIARVGYSVLTSWCGHFVEV